MPGNAPPAIRSARERIIQTLWFEALGLLCVCPLYSAVLGESAAESLGTLVALSLVVMLWSAVFNTAFDEIERLSSGRVASDRPVGLRLLHAGALELSALLLTCPLIRATTGLGWWQCLAADLALTLCYAVYGFAFHWVFDRLRPVRAAQVRPIAAAQRGEPSACGPALR